MSLGLPSLLQVRERERLSAEYVGLNDVSYHMFYLHILILLYIYMYICVRVFEVSDTVAT